MDKSKYLYKLKYDSKAHINNISVLIKTLNLKIEKLKHSKIVTDDICKKFDIECYNYNLVYEMEELKSNFTKDLEKLLKQIQQISSRNSRNVDYDIEKMQRINDLLDTYEVQLNAISKNDLSNIEKLQLNAIKKEIYEKYMRCRAEIDRSYLKEKFDKMKNRNAFLKFIDELFIRKQIVSRQTENIFEAIKGIDDCVSGFEAKSEPTREYKILDIIADIELYLNSNKKAIKKHEGEHKQILDIKEKIYSTFSIDKNELKTAIVERYKSKYPMPVEKNMDSMKRKYNKIIEFLYRSGYIRSYEEVKYKSKMETLIDKLKLLTENVQREINR